MNLELPVALDVDGFCVFCVGRVFYFTCKGELIAFEIENIREVQTELFHRFYSFFVQMFEFKHFEELKFSIKVIVLVCRSIVNGKGLVWFEF